MPPNSAITPTEVEGLRVVVMGLGRFGGGVGVTTWLCRNGADVLVTDLGSEAELAEPLSELKSAGFEPELRLGEHNVSDFTTADLVVVNPAVPKPWDNRFVRAAEAAGVTLTTEIALTIERLPERTVAVTGTVGKSTTCAMIHHALTAVGVRAHLGGNLGGSLLIQLDDTKADDAVVLELSSAMLWWLGRTGHLAQWSPAVGVVTGCAANHLDWHGTADHYRSAKQSLLDALKLGDSALLGPTVHDWPTPAGTHRITIDSDAALTDLLVPGAHNQLNAAVATQACAALVPDIDREAIAAAVRIFPGLKHRLRRLGEFITPRGARIIAFDDSKSSTPEATVTAIESVAHLGPVRLIAGGYDKGVDLSPIAQHRSVRALYAMGTTGPALVRAAGEDARSCDTLDAAVACALDEASDGDVLLLSPGCASWDQFDNFEHRGQVFAAEVCRRTTCIGP
ncbi:MAG: Mur ligase family protein [Planctomycetota bacterium]